MNLLSGRSTYSIEDPDIIYELSALFVGKSISLFRKVCLLSAPSKAEGATFHVMLCSLRFWHRPRYTWPSRTWPRSLQSSLFIKPQTQSVPFPLAETLAQTNVLLYTNYIIRFCHPYSLTHQTITFPLPCTYTTPLYRYDSSLTGPGSRSQCDKMKE